MGRAFLERGARIKFQADVEWPRYSVSRGELEWAPRFVLVGSFGAVDKSTPIP